MTNPRTNLRYPGFMAATALLGLACGCEKKPEGLTIPERPPAAVVTVPALAADVPIYIEEIGKTAARERVSVRPQISGKITSLKFEDGANVKKGDLLFTIDPRPFEAALAQAKATLAQARANVTWSESELKRVQSLKGTGAIATQEVELKQNSVEVAEATVEAGQAAVQLAQLNLEYCNITSPIDGRTGQRLIDVGNVVNSSGPDGGTELLSIQRLQPIYADFTVSEQELGRVREQLKTAAMKVEVSIPDRPDKFHPGELTFLDNAVQEGSGTIKLRATLPNEDSYFWPGQFVNVRLVLQLKKDAVLVPERAHQIGQQGPFVFVVKEDSSAELRPVVFGQRQGDLVVVESGLKAGEQIVTEGQMAIMPGGKVKVTNPSTQPAVAQVDRAGESK